jgi:ABC-type Fe3+-hydroxamate transport system substrate-binding protein
MRVRVGVVALLMVAFGSACGPGGPAAAGDRQAAGGGFPMEVADCDGNKTTIDAPPERIVTLVLGMAVLPLSPWPPAGILVAGFFIAPYMITLYALTDTLAPPARLPIAIAALGAGGPVGTAIGQAVTGALIDGPGLAAAWPVPAGCACVALVVALVNRPKRPARYPRRA